MYYVDFTTFATVSHNTSVFSLWFCSVYKIEVRLEPGGAACQQVVSGAQACSTGTGGSANGGSSGPGGAGGIGIGGTGGKAGDASGGVGGLGG